MTPLAAPESCRANINTSEELPEVSGVVGNEQQHNTHDCVLVQVAESWRGASADSLKMQQTLC